MWRGDKHGFCRRVLLLHRLRVCFELFQSRNHPFRIAREHGGGGVGEVFALTRNRQLRQGGGNRGNNGRDDNYDKRNRTSVVAITAAATKADAPADVGNKANQTDKPKDDGRDTDIVIFNVGNFVRHNSGKFFVVHNIEQPGCRANQGVLWVAARSESVRCFILDNIYFRHWRRPGKPMQRH